MTRPFILALLLLGCAGPAPPAAPGTEALMARIEARVRMPGGAEPLSRYARYYSWERRADGVRRVIGLYTTFRQAGILGLDQPPGRYWVTPEQMPGIEDGGCGVVNVTYDVASDHIESVGCNGLA
jgi:hypothetical protein